MKTKTWLEEMDRPVIEISAVGSAEPVRGHSHFSTPKQTRQRPMGKCVGMRVNHSWINGRCFWCGKPRTKQ